MFQKFVQQTIISNKVQTKLLFHDKSVRLSVCLSDTQVDQSKAVQARITKFSPSAARNYRYAIQTENLVFCILT